MDVAAIIPRWVNLRVIIILKWIQDINKGRCYLLEEALEDPNLIADVIAQEAEKWSRDPFYLSPFAKSAREQFYDYMGGKQDDITVAVAQVKLANKQWIIDILTTTCDDEYSRPQNARKFYSIYQFGIDYLICIKT